MNMELRTATDEDRPFLLSLYGSGRAAEMAAWGWSAEQQEQFIAMQFAARSRHYAAVYPGRVDSIILKNGIGVGLLSVARSETAITLVDIAILPEFQSHGLGSTLVLGLQREAAESGKTLELHVLAENSSAARLYQRLGFVCIGGDDGVYRYFEWQPEAARDTGGDITAGGEIYA